MKRLIVLFLHLLLLCGISFGQKYEPFISDTKQWTYVQTLMLTGGDGTTYLVEKCYFKGDTIWNDTVYRKFYTKQVQPNLENERVSCFIREDTTERKVYVHDFNFNRTALLYDFNLNKGDSFKIYVLDNIYHKDKVFNVDTISINNKKLKRIVFKDSITWVESLGSLTRMYIPSSGELICVKDGNSVLYLNSKFISCDMIFPQNSINAVQDIKLETPYRYNVYPNPIETSSVLKVKADNHEIFKIEIFNSLGVLVREDNFIDNYPIGLIHLSRGFHICHIKQNNKILGIDKLIVK